MKRLLSALFTLCALALNAQAATITARSNSVEDVTAAVNSATTGDVVKVPGGNVAWPHGVWVGKAIDLEAEGTVVTHNAGTNDLIAVGCSRDGHVRIGGFKFIPGTGTGRYMSVWAPEGVGWPYPMAVVHDCWFEMPTWQLIQGLLWHADSGLMYNDTFDSNADGGWQGPGCTSGCLAMKFPTYPWYNKETWGNHDTNQDINMYVEDCHFRNIAGAAEDVDDCARVVIRHCWFENSGGQSHGITSAWGGRQIEIYENKFTYNALPPNSVGIQYTNLNYLYFCRGGAARISNNQVDAIHAPGAWGDKVSWMFLDEPLTRPGNGNGYACETEAMYPGTRWAGTGSDGTQHPHGQVISPSYVDPVYIWNNSGSGASSWTTVDQSGYNCNGGSTRNVFKEGRDIFINVAPSGYTPAPYPHPLRSGAPPTPTPSATPTPAPTATPTPEPTPEPEPTPPPHPSPSPTPPGGRPTYRHWLDQQTDWIRNNPPVPD